MNHSVVIESVDSLIHYVGMGADTPIAASASQLSHYIFDDAF